MLILIALFVTTFVYNYLYHQLLVDEFLRLYFNKLGENIGQVIFYFFYCISFFIGAALSNVLSRKKILFFWVISGIISNILLIFFHSQNTIFFLLALTAVSLGFGLPSCFSFLANSTSFENRGRVSSIIQFIIFILVFAFFIVINFLNFNLTQTMILGILLRSLTLIPIYLDSYERNINIRESWSSIFKSKQTILFLVPWIFCSLSNGILIFFDQSILKIPDLQQISAIGRYMLLIGTSIFGLISGFLADRSGRKQPLILGFIALGISYTLVGISTTPTNLIIMILISGIGWGFITVILQWVIFGDLAPSGVEEKYYALGLSVYPLFEAFFQFLEGILNLSFSPNIVAIFVSIIMFLSVFPLLLVPETLPDGLIKDRRFKEYLKKVLEIIEENN
jgi:MFS family permease